MLDRDQYIKLLRQPQLVNEFSAQDLRDLAHRFSYCQSLQLLYALRLRQTSQHLFDRQLGKTAILTNDRRILFDLFEETTPIGAEESAEEVAFLRSAFAGRPGPTEQAKAQSPIEEPAVTEQSPETEPAKPLAREEKRESKAEEAEPSPEEQSASAGAEPELSHPQAEEKVAEQAANPAEAGEKAALSDRIQAILQRNRALRKAFSEGAKPGAEEPREAGTSAPSPAPAESPSREQEGALTQPDEGAKGHDKAEEAQELRPSGPSEAQEGADLPVEPDNEGMQGLTQRIEEIRIRLARLRALESELTTEEQETEPPAEEPQQDPPSAEVQPDEESALNREVEAVEMMAAEQRQEGEERAAAPEDIPAPDSDTNEEPEPTATKDREAEAEEEASRENGPRQSFSRWLKQMGKTGPLNPVPARPAESPEPEEVQTVDSGKKVAEAAPVREEGQGLDIDSKFQLLDSFVEKLPDLKKRKGALDQAPRPKPEAWMEEDKSPAELVTETLAKVYIKQKHYKKAIQAYEILKLKYPQKSSFFAGRIAEIKKLSSNK